MHIAWPTVLLLGKCSLHAATLIRPDEGVPGMRAGLGQAKLCPGFHLHSFSCLACPLHPPPTSLPPCVSLSPLPPLPLPPPTLLQVLLLHSPPPPQRATSPWWPPTMCTSRISECLHANECCSLTTAPNTVSKVAPCSQVSGLPGRRASNAHTMHLCGKIGFGMGTLLTTGNANSHRPHWLHRRCKPPLVAALNYTALRSEVYDALFVLAL